jgi:hypothetical protein
VDDEARKMSAEEVSGPVDEKPARRPYTKAALTIHGDLKEMTGKPS